MSGEPERGDVVDSIGSGGNDPWPRVEKKLLCNRRVELGNNGFAENFSVGPHAAENHSCEGVTARATAGFAEGAKRRSWEFFAKVRGCDRGFEGRAQRIAGGAQVARGEPAGGGDASFAAGVVGDGEGPRPGAFVGRNEPEMASRPGGDF